MSECESLAPLAPLTPLAPSTPLCVICLEDVHEELDDWLCDTCTKNLTVHTTCLTEWTRRTPHCPCCRGRLADSIVAEGGEGYDRDYDRNDHNDRNDHDRNHHDRNHHNDFDSDSQEAFRNLAYGLLQILQMFISPRPILAMEHHRVRVEYEFESIQAINEYEREREHGLERERGLEPLAIPRPRFTRHFYPAHEVGRPHIVRRQAPPLRATSKQVIKQERRARQQESRQRQRRR